MRCLVRRAGPVRGRGTGPWDEFVRPAAELPLGTDDRPIIRVSPEVSGTRGAPRPAKLRRPGSLGHALMGAAEPTITRSEEGDVRRASGVAAGVRGSYRAHDRAFRAGIPGWHDRHGFRCERMARG